MVEGVLHCTTNIKYTKGQLQATTTTEGNAIQAHLRRNPRPRKALRFRFRERLDHLLFPFVSKNTGQVFIHKYSFSII
jgi:hypothetical protein